MRMLCFVADPLPRLVCITYFEPRRLWIDGQVGVPNRREAISCEKKTRGTSARRAKEESVVIARRTNLDPLRQTQKHELSARTLQVEWRC